MLTFIFAVAASIFFLVVPGFAVLWAARVRDVLPALVFAPLVSVGLVGALAVVYELVGVPFEPLSAVAGAAAIAVVVWAACRFVPGVGPRPHATAHAAEAGARGTRRTLLVIASAALVAAIVWVVQVVSPLPTTDAFVQPYDVPWHMAIIERILQTGDGSSLTSGLVDATIGDNKYPIAWHDGVALVAAVTGASIPTAINASVLAISAVVWPLSMAAFALAIFGRRALPVGLVVLLGALFQAFPFRFVVYGVLYSNLLGYAIVPALMAAFMGIIGRRNVTYGGRGWAAFLFVVGIASVGLAQPNSVFTAAVLMIPFIVERICATVFGALERRGVVVRIAAAVGASLAFLAVVGAVWALLFKAPFMQRTVTFEWPPFQTFADGVVDALIFGFNGTVGQPLLGALVVLGAIVAVVRREHLGAWVRREHLWLVAAHAMMCGFYVITSSTSSVFRNVLTGFWYHDSNRLAAAVVFTAVPLAAWGLWGMGALAQRAWSRPRPVVRAGVVATVGALIVMVLTVSGPALAAQRDLLRTMATLDSGGPYTSEKDAFLAEVADIVPDGAGVANMPYDGSTYAYPLHGVDVYFKSYEANWISAPLEDSVVIRDRLVDVAADPGVCEVLERHSVRFALTMPITGINEPTPVAYIGYYEPNWHGLEITPDTPGFEPLLERNGMTLYRITACE